MPKIAVVILNWNGKKYLQQFLPSVIQYSQEATIYIADNGSTDDSVGFVQTTFPSIKIIASKDNYGFAGGYNYALSKIEADFFILLNSDVEATPNWIMPVIQLMVKDDSIAACQPKIKDYNRKDYFEYAGAAGGFIDKYGYPFCRGRIFSSIEKDHGQYDLPSEVFWATGACLFIRSEIFRSLGGFDEDFFAHMEEIDLCWRIKNMGYKIMYCPQSSIYHVGGGTLNKSNPQKTFLNFRNNLYMLYKNLPPDKLFSIILSRLILDSLAGLQFLFSIKFSHFFAIIRAHQKFFKEIPHLKQKRSQLKQNALHPNNTGIYKGAIIWDYFIKNKKTYPQTLIGRK